MTFCGSRSPTRCTMLAPSSVTYESRMSAKASGPGSSQPRTDTLLYYGSLADKFRFPIASNCRRPPQASAYAQEIELRRGKMGASRAPSYTDGASCKKW
jgi:hypothetical protein